MSTSDLNNNSSHDLTSETSENHINSSHYQGEPQHQQLPIPPIPLQQLPIPPIPNQFTPYGNPMLPMTQLQPVPAIAPQAVATDFGVPVPNPPNATAATSSTPPKTLWMGDLDPWTDEDSIINLWALMGKRVLVKLIKAKKGTPAATLNTGHAGYCFIEFETFEDAKDALTLNGSSIANTNRLFRLNWASGATLTSSIPQSAEYSLFVGDLSPTTTEAHLLALFQTHFNSVKTVRVMTDPITGTSRCFGFIRFSDEEERKRALNTMNGMWCLGRPLRVALATPRSQALNAVPGNLQGQYGYDSGPGYPSSGVGMYQQAPSDLSSGDYMYQYQSKPMNPQYLDSNDYSVQQISQDFQTLGLSPGNQLLQSQQYPQQQGFTDPKNTTIFVGGLAPGILEPTLAQVFQPFGNILHVKIPPGKGCGFIRFERREDAEAAIAGMQGFQIGGSRVRLSWGRQQQNAQQNFYNTPPQATGQSNIPRHQYHDNMSRNTAIPNASQGHPGIPIGHIPLSQNQSGSLQYSEQGSFNGNTSNGGYPHDTAHQDLSGNQSDFPQQHDQVKSESDSKDPEGKEEAKDDTSDGSKDENESKSSGKEEGSEEQREGASKE